jgi:DNA polymerase III epsilon subunit-like protein
MRFNEFASRLFEDDDLSAYVEDDADHIAIDALINTLRELQYSSNHATVPKISVEALINLVRNKPGAEAFTLETLQNAKQHNEAVKSIVANIKDDANGTKYVFINPVNTDVEVPGEDGAAAQTAPEKTVSSMANRALSNRS